MSSEDPLLEELRKRLGLTGDGDVEVEIPDLDEGGESREEGGPSEESAGEQGADVRVEERSEKASSSPALQNIANIRFGPGTGKQQLPDIPLKAIFKTAEDYWRMAIFDALIMTNIDINDVLSGEGGTPLFVGQELTTEDLGGSVESSLPGLKAVINHLSWVSDGKRRAIMAVVAFVYGEKVLDEHILTAKNSQELRNAIKMMLERYAQLIREGKLGGKK